MAALIRQSFETVAPSEADALLAESSRLLATRKLGRRRASESGFSTTATKPRRFLCQRLRCDCSSAC